MAKTTWNFKIRDISKVQAVMLAIEFWTSQGFEEQPKYSSYNKLSFKRKGQGWVQAIKAGWTGKNWDKFEIELTILIQIMPDHAKYKLVFDAAHWFTDDGQKKVWKRIPPPSPSFLNNPAP